MRPRKLTDQQEDKFLAEYELRKKLGLKSLCAMYDISRRTMLDIVRRAKSRKAKQAELA